MLLDETQLFLFRINICNGSGVGRYLKMNHGMRQLSYPVSCSISWLDSTHKVQWSQQIDCHPVTVSVGCNYPLIGELAVTVTQELWSRPFDRLGKAYAYSMFTFVILKVGCAPDNDFWRLCDMLCPNNCRRCNELLILASTRLWWCNNQYFTIVTTTRWADRYDYVWCSNLMYSYLISV